MGIDGSYRADRVADLQALLPEMSAIGQASRCILYARVSTKKQQEAGNCRQNNLRILGLWGDDIIPLAMKVLGHPIEIGQHVGVDGQARRVGGRIQFCLDR